MALVVDASVALKWFLPEEGRPQAIDLLKNAGRLHAPSFLSNEFANGLWKHVRRRTIEPERARIAMSAVYRTIDSWHSTDDLVPEALDIALSIEHPVYDLVYALLAERLRIPLVTADRRFLGKISSTRLQAIVLDLADWRPA